MSGLVGEGGPLLGKGQRRTGWGGDTVFGGQKIFHFDFVVQRVSSLVQEQLTIPCETGEEAWRDSGGLGGLSGPGPPSAAL